jgi:hypothetical protein
MNGANVMLKIETRENDGLKGLTIIQRKGGEKYFFNERLIKIKYHVITSCDIIAKG